MTNYLEPVVQKLDADISEYVAKLAEAKAAMEELQKSTSKTQNAMSKDGDKIEDALGDVSKEAEKTGDDVDKSMSKAGKGFEDVGTKAKQTGKDVDKGMKESSQATKDFERLFTGNMKDGESATAALSAAIDKQKAKIKELQGSFKSGAGSNTVFGDLKTAKADLSKIESYYKDIGGESKKIQENTGSITELFTDAMESLPQFGAAAAPFLAPVAAGSLLGLLGIGALGAGIVSNLSNPQVSGAIGTLKTDLSSSLHDATASFVPELVDGIGILDKGVSGFLTDLKPAFGALAPEVKAISQDLADGLSKSGPDFADALEKSAPVVDAIGVAISNLVQGTGKFFDGLTIGTAGEADAIRDLSAEVGSFLGQLGEGLGLVSRLYGNIEDLENGANKAITKKAGSGFGGDLWSSVKDGVEGAINPLHVLGTGLDKVNSLFKDDAKSTATATAATTNAAVEFALASTSTLTYARSLDAVITATNAWIGVAQSYDDALLSMDQAQTAFSEQLKVGKHNWDENTKGGQANVQALNASNKSITSYYDTLAAHAPLTAAQTAAELKREQQLYKTAKANGATNAELSTELGTIARLKDELALVKSKEITLTYNEHFTATYSSGAIRPGFKATASATAKGSVVDASGIVHAAKGYVSGILPPRSPGTLMLAGEPETGGEVFAPLRGISQTRAMGLAQVIGDHYGFEVHRQDRASGTAQIIGPSGPAGVSPGRASGGGNINLVMNNRIIAAFHAALISPTQQYKSRTGTTGLT